MLDRYDPRWNDDPRDRRHDDRHDRDEDESLTLGRGPAATSSRDDPSEDRPQRRDDARGLERERSGRDRHDSLDPRDVFMRDLNLPRGPERQVVHDARDRAYTLRGSESRTLSTVGAFRVVSARDLSDHNGRSADPRFGDLRHLREDGLIRTERLDGRREVAVVLTKEGRDVLESNHRGRHGDDHHTHRKDRRQEFYAGMKKPRELEHDSQLYRAYLREAERLPDSARIERVVLDYELKREYQRWLHERDRDRDDADGMPDREPHEIEAWAHDHDLPYFDDQVHFPDVRIEYEGPDERWHHQDVEVTTLHYRGAHGAAAAKSGFAQYRGLSLRLGGSARGGRSAHPRIAEEFLG